LEGGNRIPGSIIRLQSIPAAAHLIQKVAKPFHKIQGFLPVGKGSTDAMVRMETAAKPLQNKPDEWQFREKAGRTGYRIDVGK
jgi:hypothetical protein